LLNQSLLANAKAIALLQTANERSGPFLIELMTG